MLGGGPCMFGEPGRCAGGWFSFIPGGGGRIGLGEDEGRDKFCCISGLPIALPGWAWCGE